MANVVMPQAQQKQDKTNLLLQGVGMIPGPVGKVAQGVGLAKGLTAKEPAAGPQLAESGAKGAMQRRAALLQPMQPTDYGADLAAAEKAAAGLPPELQQQYLPALQAARARSQGVA